MPGEGAPQPSAGPPAEPDPAHTASTSSDQPGPGTYAGVRVLELATGVAGPYAAMFLADNGADVVKVEAAGGDPYRSDPGFQTVNRNKRSVVVDAARRDALAAVADQARRPSCAGSTRRPSS